MYPTYTTQFRNRDIDITIFIITIIGTDINVAVAS
jgi:hypothetical protein